MKGGPDLVGGHIQDLGDFADGHPGFQVFEDGLDGHPGSAEDPGPADFAGDAFDGGALGPVEGWGGHWGLLLLGYREWDTRGQIVTEWGVRHESRWISGALFLWLYS